MEKGIITGKGGLKKARDHFENMREADKEPFLKMAKKEKLAYMIKKREYDSKNKKTRTPSAYNLFMSDLKGTDPKKYSETGFFNYAYKKWKNLEDDKKRKYEKQSQKLKEENDREYKDKSSIGKNGPKKALSAYNLFIRDRLPELKKQKPDTEQTEFFGMIAEEYAKLSDADYKKYAKRAEKEKEKYEKEKANYELEMSQMNLTQLEKEEEQKEKRRETRSKTTKKDDTNDNYKSKNKSKSRSKSKTKDLSDKSSEEESEEEKTKNKKTKTKDKKNKETKQKKGEDSDYESEDNKSKRGQSKKGKKTGK